jgi:hypothetical protein
MKILKIKNQSYALVALQMCYLSLISVLRNSKFKIQNLYYPILGFGFGYKNLKLTNYFVRHDDHM